MSITCKICNKEVSEKFYRHLNSSHKMKKGDYLNLFPEQKEEYKSQISVLWNKGKTKCDDDRIMAIADKIKKFTGQEHIRKQRSENMKKMYQNGDMLSPEMRAYVQKKGTDGWVKKVKESSFEERKILLKNFSDAGNKKIQENKINRTPEDYMRICKNAKGKAQYGNCAECGNQIVIWVGGKPRPKQRFCNQSCQKIYQKKHPFYTLSHVGKHYFSEKMQCEFYLRSKLEIWFAEILDVNEKVNSWHITPFAVSYEFHGKKRLYYPDFMINSKWVVELKSGYIFDIDANKNRAKFMAAQDYSEEINCEFVYWQFDNHNMTKKLFEKDQRVIDFFSFLQEA